MKNTDLMSAEEGNAILDLKMSRRGLLRAGAVSAASLAFGALAGKTAHAVQLPYSPDYGPLALVADQATGLPLIALPQGFSYRTYGWTGDIMSDGIATPGAHDGMSVVAAKGNRITLVRNHELGSGTPFGGVVYDPLRAGGTTNLQFDIFTGQWQGATAVLSGTERNCAGGSTPWGSWLSCEETTSGPETNAALRTHGWVFECPGLGRPTGLPLTAMGRFSHEACAVDPVTGIVYETEDQGTSGFYRFMPNTYGQLHLGGQLQMLRIVGSPNLNTGGNFANNTTWNVEWVNIADPTRVHSSGTNGLGVYNQGAALGGARFVRGEGCWYDGGRIYFVSTTGGAAGRGQVFEYEPRRETLRLVFASPSSAVLNMPDNIAVSPRGGIVLCEDGSRTRQLVHGLTREGVIFPFAENNIVLAGQRNGISGNFTGQEWAGACFYDRWMFVNNQTPGITFAITGPWDNGSL